MTTKRRRLDRPAACAGCDCGCERGRFAGNQRGLWGASPPQTALLSAYLLNESISGRSIRPPIRAESGTRAKAGGTTPASLSKATGQRGSWSAISPLSMGMATIGLEEGHSRLLPAVEIVTHREDRSLCGWMPEPDPDGRSQCAPAI